MRSQPSILEEQLMKTDRSHVGASCSNMETKAPQGLEGEVQHHSQNKVAEGYLVKKLSAEG